MTHFRRLMMIAVYVLISANLAQAQTAQPPAPADALSIAEIEAQLVAQDIHIEEIELRDLVVEVEGRDAAGREVELVLDRRTGAVLSRKFDD
jgi:uncharacterized membrane protein YkoI